MSNQGVENMNDEKVQKKYDFHKDPAGKPTNKLKNEIHHSDKNYHSETGPAHVEYFEDGRTKEITYAMQGKLHNPNGPAKVIFFEKPNKHGKSVKQREMYYIDGMPHNENGPALKLFSPDGRLLKAKYCLNGETFPNKREWLMAVKTYKGRQRAILESHDPNRTPQPMKTLLAQLEKMKNQQLKQVSNVKLSPKNHVFGYDLCEKLYSLYLNNKIDFSSPPPDMFIKNFKEKVSKLFSNFEKIKVMAFFDSLKDDWNMTHGDHDESWENMLQSVKNIDMINEDRKYLGNFLTNKFDIFMQNLV
jgi:hypothetical protein